MNIYEKEINEKEKKKTLYQEEYARILLSNIFNEKCNNLQHIKPKNLSPDLIDKSKSLGFEITYGMIPKKVLEVFKTEMTNQKYDELCELQKTRTELFNFSQNCIGIKVPQECKRNHYENLSVGAKKCISILPVNNKDGYGISTGLNLDLDIYSIFGKYIKLNSPNSSYDSSLKEINLFVIDVSFEYNEWDVKTIKNHLEILLNSRDYKRKFCEIYLCLTESIYVFAPFKNQIRFFKISNEVQKVSINRAEVFSGYKR